MATTSFTFKPPTGTWFYLALAIVFGGVALNFAIQIVLYQGFTFTALIALFIPILISVPACILFNVCLLRSQYHSNDMGKKLEFDKIKRQLKVCKNNNTHIINHEDIKCVELHKSYTNFFQSYIYLDI